MTESYPGLPTHVLSKAIVSLGFVMARQSRRYRLFRHEDGRVTTLPVNEHSYLPPLMVGRIARDIGPELDDYLKWME